MNDIEINTLLKKRDDLKNSLLILNKIIREIKEKERIKKNKEHRFFNKENYNKKIKELIPDIIKSDVILTKDKAKELGITSSVNHIISDLVDIYNEQLNENQLLQSYKGLPLMLLYNYTPSEIMRIRCCGRIQIQKLFNFLDQEL